MSNWVSVVKSVEKGRMGWGRPSSGLLNSCSSISSPEPEAWRTLQGNALGSHGRTGGCKLVTHPLRTDEYSPSLLTSKISSISTRQ